MPELWLIRHGETAWSLSGAHTGRTDVPLTEEGKRRAAALGVLLHGHEFAQVLSSPLSRARDTWCWTKSRSLSPRLPISCARKSDQALAAPWRASWAFKRGYTLSALPSNSL